MLGLLNLVVLLHYRTIDLLLQVQACKAKESRTS